MCRKHRPVTAAFLSLKIERLEIFGTLRSFSLCWPLLSGFKKNGKVLKNPGGIVRTREQLQENSSNLPLQLHARIMAAQELSCLALAKRIDD